MKSPFGKGREGPHLQGSAALMGHLAELSLSRRLHAAASSAFHNRSCRGRDDICDHCTFLAIDLQRGYFKPRQGPYLLTDRVLHFRVRENSRKLGVHTCTH